VRVDDEFLRPAAGVDARSDDIIAPIMEWTHESITTARQYQSDLLRRNVGLRFSDRLVRLILRGRVVVLCG
jgi:hypothetical protein